MRQLKITKQITQRNDEIINRYFQEISRYPAISAEEEVELTIRIRSGDQEALERLVVSNLRFVISVAKQYQNQGLSFSDLINEGNMGLVKAATKYDETRGFKFISYAVWWIRQAIMQAISEQTRIVHLPLNRLSTINRITKAIPYLEQKLNRDPTDSELAEHLELTREEVTIANDIKKRQISFDLPLSNQGDNDFSLYDVIQNGNIPAPDNKMMQESLVINISRALSKLNKREAEVLVMAFGLCNTPSYTLYDIATKYGMSTERVRQIKSTGLFKLKRLLKGNHMFFTAS